jgi:hypothetical protein
MIVTSRPSSVAFVPSLRWVITHHPIRCGARRSSGSLVVHAGALKRSVFYDRAPRIRVIHQVHCTRFRAAANVSCPTRRQVAVLYTGLD